MIRYRTLLLIVILSLTLSIQSIGQAQNIQKFFSKAKVGEWVELEGRAQPDMSIILKEIEMVRGEMEDDDWEITGKIRAVNREEKTIYILNIPIRFDENSEYEDDYDIIKSFSDIKKGMTVEIEGQYTSDGVFLVKEIGTSEEKKDESNSTELVGKIQAIDPASHTIIVMGQKIVFTPESRIKSLMY